MHNTSVANSTAGASHHDCSTITKYVLNPYLSSTLSTQCPQCYSFDGGLANAHTHKALAPASHGPTPCIHTPTPPPHLSSHLLQIQCSLNTLDAKHNISPQLLHHIFTAPNRPLPQTCTPTHRPNFNPTKACTLMYCPLHRQHPTLKICP